MQVDPLRRSLPHPIDPARRTARSSPIDAMPRRPRPVEGSSHDGRNLADPLQVTRCTSDSDGGSSPPKSRHEERGSIPCAVMEDKVRLRENGNQPLPETSPPNKDPDNRIQRQSETPSSTAPTSGSISRSQATPRVIQPTLTLPRRGSYTDPSNGESRSSPSLASPLRTSHAVPSPRPLPLRGPGDHAASALRGPAEFLLCASVLHDINESTQ